MNKFKMAFALLAVLVILAAPAYAQPAPFSAHAPVSRPLVDSCLVLAIDRLKTAAEFGETLYAEGQT